MSDAYLFINPFLVQSLNDTPQLSFKVYPLLPLEVLLGQIGFGHDSLHQLNGQQEHLESRLTLSSVTPTLQGCLDSTWFSNNSL
jgi:mRNA deadenylase 3'-5' endonuclease subunit Ccr4